MNPEIIFQNKNFIAVNKPAGLLVHTSRSAIDSPVRTAVRNAAGGHQSVIKRKEKTLVDFLVKKFPEIKTVGDNPVERPGIVHRLDKETSGIILIARNQKYFEYLKNLFQERKIKKTYLALVFGNIQANKGVINKPISLKAGTVRHTVHKGKMSKDAVTEYETVKRFSFEDPDSVKRKLREYSLVKAIPRTGRTHQIRVHLSSIGYAIVGDVLYGRRDDFLGLKRQFLHASLIEFESEPGTLRVFEVPLPKELDGAIQKLTHLTRGKDVL